MDELISLFVLILFILIVLALNILVQRGAITVISRLARSVSVGIVVIIIYDLTLYYIQGTYHQLIMIAVIMQFFIAMGISLVVWVGYWMFGSSKQKKN